MNPARKFRFLLSMKSLAAAEMLVAEFTLGAQPATPPITARSMDANAYAITNQAIYEVARVLREKHVGLAPYHA